MTLASLFSELVEGCQFRHLGEEALFTPVGGVARTITAIPVEADPELIATYYSEEVAEAVWLSVMRNASDPDWGGVAAPAVGDTVILCGDSAAPYAYLDRKRHITSTQWALLFGRGSIDAYRPDTRIDT